MASALPDQGWGNRAQPAGWSAMAAETVAPAAVTGKAAAAIPQT